MGSMYDALLLVSFGGPEGPDDVIPFLENVTRGRGIPRERLAAVGEHYYRFGGVSPINGHCRALKAALEQTLDIPVYWGNRNWQPYLADAVRRMTEDGVRRAAAFVTSAYSGYSLCRQYLDDIDRTIGTYPDAPVIEKLRIYYNHPGFIETFRETTAEALTQAPGARLVFTAHSVPIAQPGRDLYEAELREAAALVAGDRPWDLVFQSRSGPPTQPWLEPDICHHVERLAAEGVREVVAVPIGFTSDHMEVVYDLDTEAAELAAKLGMTFVRAATPGVHPRFVRMVGELIAERATTERPCLGARGPRPDFCPPDCCRS